MTLTLLDWRRTVFAVYAAVRDCTDPAVGHELWRAGRSALFAHHPESPLPPDDPRRRTGVPVAPYDPGLRFVVEVDVDVAPERLDVPTATDGVVPFDRVGRVHLAAFGSLDVWALRSYGGGLFVPLKDASSGRTTYGGGRYLLDTVKGADLGGDVDLATGRGSLVVDLNFAYHPSCAYDWRWACPLAPPGNVLDVAVDGGELLPADEPDGAR